MGEWLGAWTPRSSGMGWGLGLLDQGEGAGGWVSWVWGRGWVSWGWGRGWGLGLLQPFPFTPTEQRKRYSTEVVSDVSTNAVNVSLGLCCRG